MKREDEITDEIYKRYGTNTGILFGISPELKIAVRAIVRLTLEINGEE